MSLLQLTLDEQVVASWGGVPLVVDELSSLTVAGCMLDAAENYEDLVISWWLIVLTDGNSLCLFH